MMTEAKLIEYFNEHVLYELLMLRYTHQQLQSCKDQLHWNAMFTAFSVNARNIYDFLFPDGNLNVGAKDFKAYSRSFEANGRQEIAGTIDKLHRHCFHLGKKRTELIDEKVSLDRVNEVFKWADSTMRAFIDCLTFKDLLDLNGADPGNLARSLTLKLPPAGFASATNHPQSILTTSHGEMVGWEVNTK